LPSFFARAIPPSEANCFTVILKSYKQARRWSSTKFTGQSQANFVLRLIYDVTPGYCPEQANSQ
jgi:hypothetical protein